MAFSLLNQIIQILDSLDIDAPKPHSAMWPSQTPRTMIARRRHRERNCSLHYQQSHGRPDFNWKLCGNEDCAEPCCMKAWDEPSYLLVDGEQNMDGALVKDIWSEFAALMVSKIWRSSWWGLDSMLIKLHAIESFVLSPPVRRAYLDFKIACEDNDIRILTEDRLKENLLHVLPRFFYLLTKIDEMENDKLIHYLLKQPERYGHRPAWVLEDWIMQFLLTIELWRRKEVREYRRRHWTFESPKVVAELLVAILHNFYNMDREHCFEIEDYTGSDGAAIVSAQYDRIWQRWMDTYPPLSEEGDADDNYDVEAEKKRHDFAPRPVGEVGWDIEKGLGYLGGIGRAEPPRLGPVIRDEDDEELPQH